MVCLTRLSIQKYRFHIYFEQTQGGAAAPYLMKYALKPPYTTDVRVQKMRKSQSSKSQNAVKDMVRHDIRVLMRARTVDSVEVCRLSTISALLD